MKRMSSGVSTKTLMSISSSRRCSAKMRMPSMMMIELRLDVQGLGAARVCLEVVERQLDRAPRL